ncbi:hypothetical protein ACFLZN_02710 [Nanoarchaeota archaeon]
MDEVKRTISILKEFELSPNCRDSKFGKFLTHKKDHISTDSFDVYFNRSTKKEGIDIQIRSYTFNFSEWANSIHKLAELLLLKGARIEDIENLHSDFKEFLKK